MPNSTRSLSSVYLAREKKRLEERLGGITTLAKRPDALLVIDTKREKHAVKEANDAGIPVIAHYEFGLRFA